jgi:hypothetical protein
VVSASPADPPAVSFAGTDAPLLSVPLTRGPRLSARAGGSMSRPQSRAARACGPRRLGKAARGVNGPRMVEPAQLIFRVLKFWFFFIYFIDFLATL